MPAEAPTPAGIGNCGTCPYLVSGTAAICYECARQTIEALAPADERCVVCDLPLKDDGTCGNPLCSWDDDRWFSWNYAIAMRSGVLERAIGKFKYEDRHGWALIFGRVLVGFLDEQARTFENFDLIIPSPTFLGEGGRTYDHTRAAISVANDEAEGRWPFDVADPPAIVRTAAVPRMVGHTWRERKDIAEGPLRAALAVTDLDRTRDATILVYDDVFTDGFTLREVARCLRVDGGAAEVCGVTLTRQPWNR